MSAVISVPKAVAT